MIFKAAIFSTVILAVLAANDKCSKGWTFFQGSCYKTFPENTDYYDVSDVELNCESHDGYVTEITSQEENDFVKDLVRKVANANITGVFLGARYYPLGSVWEWRESNSQISFSNWSNSDDEHPNTPDVKFCSTMSTEGAMAWVARNCDKIEEMMSVCEKYPVQKSCFHGSCYELLRRSTRGSYAEDRCDKAGGTMLKINSTAENDFVKDFLSGVTRNVWLGAKDEGSEGNFWWVSDHSAVDFDNWAPGEPNNSGSRGQDENCVTMDSGKDWRWNDVRCVSSYALICESAGAVSG